MAIVTVESAIYNKSHVKLRATLAWISTLSSIMMPPTMIAKKNKTKESLSLNRYGDRESWLSRLQKITWFDYQ